MGGLLKLAVVAGVLWFFYQMLVRAASSAAQAGTAPPPVDTAANRMRKCSHCGVHIPEGESTQSRGHFFCCEAHRNAFFSHQQ